MLRWPKGEIIKKRKPKLCYNRITVFWGKKSHSDAFFFFRISIGNGCSPKSGTRKFHTNTLLIGRNGPNN